MDEIDDNNMNLKCYMYCLFHTFEHYEETHNIDEFDFFTNEEVEILLEMSDKCESYEYNEQHDEKCEYAFKLNKCWKMANPEVKINFTVSLVNSLIFFLSFFTRKVMKMLQFV